MNPRDPKLLKKEEFNIVTEYQPRPQPSVVEESQLRKLLNDAIDAYIKNDVSWLHRDNQRAEDYKNDLKLLDDAQLAKKVFEDISMEMGYGPLGTSKKLRERLTLALRVHLGITDDDIIRNADRRTYSMTMYGYSVVLVENQRRDVIYNLIGESLSKNVEMTSLKRL